MRGREGEKRGQEEGEEKEREGGENCAREARAASRREEGDKGVGGGGKGVAGGKAYPPVHPLMHVLNRLCLIANAKFCKQLLY